MVLHDKDIREPLFDFLEMEYGKIRIIEEKTMGRSRADVVMVTENALFGIEIKSDADTYERLSRQVKAEQAADTFDRLSASIKEKEQRLQEIATLKKHIFNYSRTRSTYEDYRKSGYSKKFLEEHREEITLHKAAKAAFDELSVKKLQKIKELNAEYAAILSEKKSLYGEYRRARKEMQEYAIARKNVETILEIETGKEVRTTTIQR